MKWVDPIANSTGAREALAKICYAQNAKDFSALQGMKLIYPDSVDQQIEEKSCGVYCFLNSVGIVAEEENYKINLDASISAEPIFLNVSNVKKGVGLQSRSQKCLDVVTNAMQLMYTECCERDLAIASVKLYK